MTSPASSWVAALVATPQRRALLLLLGLGALLYIPWAGNYAGWDPWETHYGEIARQMRQRGDVISLWWPCSPIDRAEVFHKPVLHFWLMAASMWLFGIEGPHPAADELTRGWTAEWALRMPNVLLGLASCAAVWLLVCRLAGRRAATLSALVLMTSTQWMLITRQAMTDLPFVAPMTGALALGGLALLSPEGELVRRSWRRFSWPHQRAFYLLVAALALLLVQLIVFAAQLREVFVGRLRLPGVVLVLPHALGWMLALWWCARATQRRQIYLFGAYVLCGLATLAKGPAGLAIPALVLLSYLVLVGRWRDLLFKLELPRGLLLFIVTAFPWYHAMLVRHGVAFWNELIGDNYVNRALGRNGDRGSFDYYLQCIAYGMFPWSGIVATAVLSALRRFGRSTPRQALMSFALAWAAVAFTVVSAVTTKFHHYILPALPALAIVAGLFLDELLDCASSERAKDGLLLLVVGGLATLLSGRDLATYPARILWMFNYDYVNMPGTGRPWPAAAIYGDRYEYGSAIAAFAVAATVATFLLGWFASRTNVTASAAKSATAWSLKRTGFMALLFVAALVGSIASGPITVDGRPPLIHTGGWLWPVLLALPFLALLYCDVFGRDILRRPGLAALLLVSVVWSGFVLDRVVVELSPHWGQKHVVGAYYRLRQSPSEPLVVWTLYWRGETFYTRNAIYDAPLADDKTVFLGPRNAERLQAYLTRHGAGRVFFLVERARLEALRGLLPPATRAGLTIVDDSNNKLVLALATLP